MGWKHVQFLTVVYNRHQEAGHDCQEQGELVHFQDALLPVQNVVSVAIKHALACFVAAIKKIDLSLFFL